MDTPVTEALVMCGGAGTRLDVPAEKPLVKIGGTSMIDRVLDALTASGITTQYAAVSPQTPATRRHLAEKDGVTVLDTPGDGYVTDLQTALSDRTTPVMTLAADLPLLAGSLVDRIRAAYTGSSMTVVIPAVIKRHLDVSIDSSTVVDGRIPAGVNIVDPGTSNATNRQTYVSYDVRLAVNVNRVRDREIAEAIACG